MVGDGRHCGENRPGAVGVSFKFWNDRGGINVHVEHCAVEARPRVVHRPRPFIFSCSFSRPRMI